MSHAAFVAHAQLTLAWQRSANQTASAPHSEWSTKPLGDLFLAYEYHIASSQLIFAMLGMGVTLRPDAFMEVMRFPKGFALGLISVLLVSPTIAFGIAKASLWPVQAGVPDPFADPVFFVAFFYRGIAFMTSLPGVLIHRRTTGG
jgi:hypothetical protein